jgi:Ca2+-binding EF-hand superfamily protein
MSRHPTLACRASVMMSFFNYVTGLNMTSYFDRNMPDVVMRSLFMKYDTDNSGGLGSDELKRLFKEDLGLNEEQAQAYVLLLDVDGNADVSYEEFTKWLRSGEKLSMVTDASRYKRVKRAVDLFNKFDTDGNRSLDREEFKQLFIRTGGKPRYFDNAFRQLDKDGNGIISFQELLRWLNWVQMDYFD